MNFYNIKKGLRRIVSLLIVITIFGCSTSNEEVSAQLEEIKKQITALKLESSQIRSAITEIHRATIKPVKEVAAVPQKIIPEVSIGKGRAILGDKNAKIAIIEFSDYECPFCSRFYKQTLGQIKLNYLDTGKVAFIYRDYPLNFHSQAKKAAIAANCSGIQNKYWEMHNQLFENNRNLNNELYLNLAKELKLNQNKFIQCLDDKVEKDLIENDIAYAQTLGVNGTPSFFIGKLEGDKIINAKRLTGAQPFSVFSRIIDSIQ